MPDPTTIIVSFLSGGVTGSIITACVTGSRDKKHRRNAFIGFLEKWKAEISAPDRGPTIIGVATAPAIKAYDAKVGAFKEQVAIVRDVFSGNHRFETLAIRLGSLKSEDWKDKQPRNVILEAIEKLIEFAA